MVTLQQLRKSLSECHTTKDDKHMKLLQDVKNPEYYLHRIMECIHACEAGEDIDANTKLGIQLFNMFRVHHRGPIQAEREQEGRAGGDNSNGDNKRPEDRELAGDSDSR